jgi:hypothetical protein
VSDAVPADADAVPDDAVPADADAVPDDAVPDDAVPIEATAEPDGTSSLVPGPSQAQGDLGGGPPAGFAARTAVTELGVGHLVATIDPGWTIGGKPNGGYLLALMARAARVGSPHPHPVAVSAHYLHAPDTGPCDVVVETLRRGRSASQVRARLQQGGQPCVEALVTLAKLDAADVPFWDGAPAGPVAPPEDCVRLPGTTPTGATVALLDEVDLRLDPATAGFASGRPSGRGELQGWLALAAGEAFDPISLLFAVDALPPATFDIAPSGWVPTLELTAYVRALPAPGPVQVHQRARLIDAQRVDEVCTVWDATGRLVAQATQLAGTRLG